jgi:KamA family protein
MLTVAEARSVELGMRRFRAHGADDIDWIAERHGIPADLAATARLFSLVLPFKTNDYVLGELIDWSRIPDDPVFQLTFPQPGMLDAGDERALAELVERRGEGSPEVMALVADIRRRLNPHPAGQLTLNVPRLDDEPVRGVQHKYRSTVLYFPSNGQTCHAHCTYCFRWPQFVGDADLRFASPGPAQLVEYLRAHPDVSDVLLTGGDPAVMATSQLRAHVAPLLEVDTVRTIRIGTKSLAYWPQRFVTDRDADDLLRLFEEIETSGRTIAVMAHVSHDVELQPEISRQAVERIRSTGAVVFGQAPIIARVNDDARTWEAIWRASFEAGIVPYYMFVARDTGPHEYFKVPLARAVAVFGDAYRELPGLARTVRGPVMSSTAGKIAVDGELELGGRRFFQLRFLQARDRALVGRPFLARWSDSATWIDELELDDSVPADIAAAIGAR